MLLGVSRGRWVVKNVEKVRYVICERPQTSPLTKDSQFSSNLTDIQAKLPTHELVSLTKFHNDCEKIVDFLLTQTFLVCALFYASPFRKHSSW